MWHNNNNNGFDLVLSYFPFISIDVICNQSGVSTQFCRENTPGLKHIAAALDAEIAIKGLYRLPQKDIQAVILQDVRKLIVYLISAKPTSLQLHLYRQERQKYSLSFLFTSPYTLYTSSFTKMLFLNLNICLSFPLLSSGGSCFLLCSCDLHQYHTFALASHSLLEVWVINDWLRSQCNWI